MRSLERKLENLHLIFYNAISREMLKVVIEMKREFSDKSTRQHLQCGTMHCHTYQG